MHTGPGVETCWRLSIPAHTCGPQPLAASVFRNMAQQCPGDTGATGSATGVYMHNAVATSTRIPTPGTD